jgi:type II secretory pathway pseudopilin PulG
MKRFHRTAFSLSELMVILALLAVLSAMFFPAILKIRSAANRARRESNMRQLGIAMNNYDATYRALPKGVDEKNFSVATRLLPFIEQNDVFAKIDFNKPVDDKVNLEAAKLSIPLLQNDFDPVKKVTGDLPGTNILFCAGSKPGLADNDGVFGRKDGAQFSLAQIPAGTSNVMMAVCTLKGDGSDKGTDVRRQHVRLDKAALKDLKDDTGVEDFKEGKHIVGNRCANWMDGRFLQGTFNTSRLPNDDKPDVDCGGEGGLMSVRTLDGYILIGYFDGHVSSVPAKKIDLKRWQELSNAGVGYGELFDK